MLHIFKLKTSSDDYFCHRECSSEIASSYYFRSSKVKERFTSLVSEGELKETKLKKSKET